MSTLFGTDGVRGRAGQGPLTPANIRHLAACVGGLLRQRPASFRTPLPRAFRGLRAHPVPGASGCGKVLIGRDPRTSGPAIEHALVQGFASAGCEAVLAGVIPTPGVACLTRRWGCALGVVVSASHNPADDNGIKFFSPQGFKIPDAAEEDIERRYARSRTIASSRRKKTARDVSAQSGEYLDFLASFAPSLRGLKIVMDCGHGAASAFAKPLVERLGGRVVLMHAAPDGYNINVRSGALHPEGVARAVRRERADLGVAYDGDADRAIFVDERGVIRDGDSVLALCATRLKARRALPGNAVVSTSMSNFGLERYLAERGIELRRARVGDKFVAEEMLASGAILGGEPSGHILFFDVSPAGDGLLTTLRVLRHMVDEESPLSELVGGVPRYPQIILNVTVGRKPPLEDIPEVRRRIEAARKTLGTDGRIVVRYSGTEPLCRVMVEGPRTILVRRLAGDVAVAVGKELT